MTPQSTFMILAPLVEEHEASLATLLASMNGTAGMADPHNDIMPFGRFERLHVARFVIVKSETATDISAYGIKPGDWPPSLALLGDVDGPAEAFLAELAARCGAGLRRLFAHCRGFAADTELLPWMRQHSVIPAATYVNWFGRTVVQFASTPKPDRLPVQRQVHCGLSASPLFRAQHRMLCAGLLTRSRPDGCAAFAPP